MTSSTDRGYLNGPLRCISEPQSASAIEGIFGSGTSPPCRPERVESPSGGLTNLAPRVPPHVSGSETRVDNDNGCLQVQKHISSYLRRRWIALYQNTVSSHATSSCEVLAVIMSNMPTSKAFLSLSIQQPLKTPNVRQDQRPRPNRAHRTAHPRPWHFADYYSVAVTWLVASQGFGLSWQDIPSLQAIGHTQRAQPRTGYLWPYRTPEAILDLVDVCLRLTNTFPTFSVSHVVAACSNGIVLGL